MKKIKINIAVLVACLVIVYFVAFLGSIFTSGNTNSEWYLQHKPSITPPNWVFPVVWTLLFFLIGLSLYFAWTSKKADKPKIIIVFTINFMLNIFWSILYFSLKNPRASFIEIIFLWLSILSMVIVTFKIEKKSAYLLLPYLIWVLFAGVLNYLTI